MLEQGSSSPTTDPRGALDEQGWRVRAGMPLREAELLLDWLDQAGCTSREVLLDEAGVTVRWRPQESNAPM